MYIAANVAEELKHPRAKKAKTIKNAVKHFEVWNRREETENEIKNI